MNEIFVAVISEEIDNSWFRSDLFLVNATKSPLLVKQKQGSFDGADADEKILDLGFGEKGVFELAPGSFHQIDKMEDGGELDFMTWYNFTVKDTKTNEVKKLFGQINGHGILYGRVEMLPVINTKGVRLELDDVTKY